LANIAIFASGSGSNFEALATSFKGDKKNEVKLLICNKKNAYVIERAKNHNIKCELINYLQDGQLLVEKKVTDIIKHNKIDVIFLAGFMRVLSAKFIKDVGIPIINIHPSLLPKHKGSDAIKKAYDAGDKEIGISIHHVSEEVDGGEIILQESIPLEKEKGLDFIESEVHKLEHLYYPQIAKQICEEINSKRN